MQFPGDKDKLVLNNSAIRRASMACPYFREHTGTARSSVSASCSAPLGHSSSSNIPSTPGRGRCW